MMEHLDALYLVFLRIHHPQRTLVTAAQQVADDGTARLVRIVRTTDDNDTLRL